MGAFAAAIALGMAPGAPDGEGAVGGKASPERGGKLARPKMRFDPISYGAKRKRQMAGYSKRHYGKRAWRLRKSRALVLHYTAGPSYASAWSTFDSNAPALGEKPGVCAHFVVDKDGTIYQLVRMSVRCRHTIGLNHRSIGIEMVQESLGGRRSERAILDRKPQARAAVRLAAWLRQRHGIKFRNVIGHAMANKSPLFEDRRGWRNDHTDWRAAEVRIFRKRMKRLLQKRRSAARPADATAAGTSRRVRFGRSVEGRPLVARRLGNVRNSRKVLVVGETHGDEPAGRPVIRRLRERFGRIKGVDLWTAVSVNPDGHRVGSRKNARGVDLNRNFSYRWSNSEPPASGYYGGPKPFSEPESRALRRLIRRIEPALTIHYHQPWGAVLAPCKGSARPEKRYSRIARLPVQRCRGEKLPGTATSWQEKRVGGTAFVVELRAGKLSKGGVIRHARAVAALARG